MVSCVCVSLSAGEWGRHGPRDRSQHPGDEIRAALCPGTDCWASARGSTAPSCGWLRAFVGSLLTSGRKARAEEEVITVSPACSHHLVNKILKTGPWDRPFRNPMCTSKVSPEV